MVGDESPQRRWTKKCDIVVVRLGERSGSFAHRDASSRCALVVTCANGGNGQREERYFSNTFRHQNVSNSQEKEKMRVHTINFTDEKAPGGVRARS